MKENFTAVIPARFGSKRLKNKNIRMLNEKPLIQWTIEAAMQSKYVNNIIISTNIPQVIELGTKLGLGDFSQRPEFLCTDSASTRDVMLYEAHDKHISDGALVILQPTSPLRNYKHIDSAIELYRSKSALGVVSVSESDHPPVWSNTLPKNLSMHGFIAPKYNKRQQDLGTFYRFNGAIFIYDVREYVKNENIINSKETYAYIMDRVFSIDIDNELDFEFSEMTMKKITYAAISAENGTNKYKDKKV